MNGWKGHVEQLRKSLGERLQFLYFVFYIVTGNDTGKSKKKTQVKKFL